MAFLFTPLTHYSTNTTNPINKKISPEDPPSELSSNTKASVSSRASSFAHLLSRRSKTSSLQKLAKKASKGIRPQQQHNQTQTVNNTKAPASPKIIEISSPTRPDLSRSVTNPEVSTSNARVTHSLLAPPAFNNSSPTLKRPSAQRIRSAFELQHKIHVGSHTKSPILDQAPSASTPGPYARRPSLDLQNSHSSDEAPLYLTRSASPIFGQYMGFNPRHIKESTIEEDTDSPDGTKTTFAQTPRLGSPLSPAPPDLPRRGDESRHSRKTRKLFDRLLRRGASEDLTETQRLAQSTPDLNNKTPASLMTTSSQSSRMSYFVGRHSSETQSPVSPKTVVSSSVRTPRYPPQSPGGPLDIKGWLDLNRAPATPFPFATQPTQSQAVDMTTPGTPSFLPSEMRRVNTPPLQPAVTVRKQRSIYRGLHLDRHQLAHLNASDELGVLPSTPIKPLMPNPPLPYQANQSTRQTGRKQQRLSNQDIDRSGIDKIMNEPEQGEETDAIDCRPRVFSFDVPAHLPNSPLCPLHPKHAGGPKSLCPMHGRARRSKAQMQRSGS